MFEIKIKIIELEKKSCNNKKLLITKVYQVFLGFKQRGDFYKNYYIMIRSYCFYFNEYY